MINANSGRCLRLDQNEMDFFRIDNGVLIRYAGPGGDLVIPREVTIIGRHAFYHNYSVTSVTIPDTVTGIGEDAFAHCRNLERVIIPDSVTAIGAQAFFGCENLSRLEIPDSVVCIGSGAFRNCYSLANHGDFFIFRDVLHCYRGSDSLVRVPDGVKEIAPGAFYRNLSITSVEIPDSVISIGEESFHLCQRLRSVTFGANCVGKSSACPDHAVNFWLYSCFQSNAAAAQALFFPHIPLHDLLEPYRYPAAVGFAAAMEYGITVSPELEEANLASIRKSGRFLYHTMLRNPPLLRFMVRRELLPPEDVPELLAETTDPMIRAMLLERCIGSLPQDPTDFDL